MQNLASLANSGAPGVVGAIRQASAESGVDFSYLLEKAAAESSLNPSARAGTSSASGLYQFIDQTWLTEVAEHGGEYGLGAEAAAISIDGSGHASVSDPGMRREIMALKDDAKVATEMAAAFTKDNQAYLQSVVGGRIGGTELYLAHFLGAGGAAKFLKAMRQNPSQEAADLLPAAADANEPVFYHADGTARSLGEIYNRFAAKFDGTAVATGGAGSTYTAMGSLSGMGASARGISSFTVSPASGGTSLDDDSQWRDAGRASLYEMLVLSQLSATEAGQPQKAASQKTGNGQIGQGTAL